MTRIWSSSELQLQRDVLGAVRRVAGSGLAAQRRWFPAPHLGFGGGRAPRSWSCPLPNPFLEAVARVLGQQPNQSLIEAHACALRRNGEVVMPARPGIFYIFGILLRIPS